MLDFKKLAQQYKYELFDKVIPFWLNNSQDLDFGGYFTCLDRAGAVYDTDKFIWLQAREVWMFAKLYNTVERKQEWLDCAVQGAEFLKKHGHDGELNWYFALTRDGAPLVAPYNIFSYTFATIAFGQLALATQNEEYAQISKDTFCRVLDKVNNPKGQWNKSICKTRSLKTFDLPMILCNVALEIEHLIDKDFLNKTIDTCLHEVLDVFYQKESGLIVEALDTNGTLVDTLDGRKMNPGHAIEATWFVMDLGVRLNRPQLIEKATKICINEIKYGWDDEYGGIFYFMDRLGKPRHELEFDQKLWWVHIESLIATLKGYSLTGSQECLEWFERIHNYTWQHFADPIYPEWYGYLNREGKVLLPLKGGKWKGCFHVPRGLMNCWMMLEDLSKK